MPSDLIGVWRRAETSKYPPAKESNVRRIPLAGRQRLKAHQLECGLVAAMHIKRDDSLAAVFCRVGYEMALGRDGKCLGSLQAMVGKTCRADRMRRASLPPELKQSAPKAWWVTANANHVEVAQL